MGSTFLLFHLFIGLALWARQNRLQEKKANRVRRGPLQSSENHFTEGKLRLSNGPLMSGSSIRTFFSPLSHLTTTSFLFNPLPVFPELGCCADRRVSLGGQCWRSHARSLTRYMSAPPMSTSPMLDVLRAIAPHSQSWPQTPDPPASVFQMLELQVYRPLCASPENVMFSQYTS